VVFNLSIGDTRATGCITQQLNLGVREQKGLNTTVLGCSEAVYNMNSLPRVTVTTGAKFVIRDINHRSTYTTLNCRLVYKAFERKKRNIV
jgi:hypothetical protein